VALGTAVAHIHSCKPTHNINTTYSATISSPSYVSSDSQRRGSRHTLSWYASFSLGHPRLGWQYSIQALNSLSCQNHRHSMAKICRQSTANHCALRIGCTQRSGLGHCLVAPPRSRPIVAVVAVAAICGCRLRLIRAIRSCSTCRNIPTGSSINGRCCVCRSNGVGCRLVHAALGVTTTTPQERAPAICFWCCFCCDCAWELGL
jgi:hypothetical protein